MHDGQIAVHAHARDKEDRCVEVEVVESSADFAGDLTKGPAVAPEVVNRPQRERQLEQQVRHTQVQHESVRYSSPRGAAVGQHAHRQSVGYGSQHADNTVDGGDNCSHGYMRPVWAGGSRGGHRGVQIELCCCVKGGREVGKGEIIWDGHYGTGCTLASHNLASLLQVSKVRWK